LDMRFCDRYANGDTDSHINEHPNSNERRSWCVLCSFRYADLGQRSIRDVPSGVRRKCYRRMVRRLLRGRRMRYLDGRRVNMREFSHWAYELGLYTNYFDFNCDANIHRNCVAHTVGYAFCDTDPDSNCYDERALLLYL